MQNKHVNFSADKIYIYLNCGVLCIIILSKVPKNKIIEDSGVVTQVYQMYQNANFMKCQKRWKSKKIWKLLNINMTFTGRSSLTWQPAQWTLKHVDTTEELWPCHLPGQLCEWSELPTESHNMDPHTPKIMNFVEYYWNKS